MVKKYSLVVTLTTTIAFGCSTWAGCLPGNEEYFPTQNPSAETWCCKPVGDGTVLSCTDGDSWFNVPHIDTVDN